MQGHGIRLAARDGGTVIALESSAGTTPEMWDTRGPPGLAQFFVGRLADAPDWQRFSVGWFEKEEVGMPEAWTNKDERMYEHVKKSEKDRGRSAERAKEIAARTVNRQRREEGRTPQRSSQGTGNPNTRLEDRSVDELRNRARELNRFRRTRWSCVRRSP